MKNKIITTNSVKINYIQILNYKIFELGWGGVLKYRLNIKLFKGYIKYELNSNNI